MTGYCGDGIAVASDGKTRSGDSHVRRQVPGMVPDNGRMAAIFAALSNPVRIDILRHVAKHRHCGCKDITNTLPLAQSTVSQHLKVLAEAGLIRVTVAHPRSHYDVDEALIAEMSRSISGFLDSCCSSASC